MSLISLGIDQKQPAVIGAGFWMRALARLADTFYANVVAFAAGIAAAITLALLQQLSMCEPGWASRLPHFLALLPASLLGDLLFRTICEGVCGATPGKFVCGLRVLSENQGPCGIGSAFIRSIAYFFDCLFFGLIAYLSMNKTPLEQRYGDHWGGTIVVRTKQVPPESKQSGPALFWTMALGSIALALPLWATVVLTAFE